MPDLDKLLGASKKAFGCNTVAEKKFNTELNSVTLNKDSTRQEVLDYIMIFLCERIDLRYNAFKGGYVLTKLIPTVARATEDIDFSVSNEKQYYEIIPVLEELGEVLLNLGVIQSYSIKPTIGEHSSGGITMVTDGKTRNIKIDIGWHDLSWGVSKWMYEGFECNRFEVERMLADKISAIYSRRRFRRPKDLYDFYILTSNFDVSTTKLRECIVNRGSIDWNASPFTEDVMIEYAKAYDTLRVDTIDGVEVDKPDYNSVIGRLRVFMNKYDEDITWDHLDKMFRR